MPAPGWEYAKILGQEPDIVVKSEQVTIPAIGQHEWWKPVSDVPVTEQRWIRAVEMRPASVSSATVVGTSCGYVQVTSLYRLR